jgi:Tachylectin
MSMKHILYSGNGSALVDSGPPFTDEGKFLAVNENGDLLYFRYDGDGEQDPTGTRGFTGPGNNSGNQIGRGFQDFIHLLGCGDGVILGVKSNGDLTYFQYSGNGEEDPTGTLGFEGPNQGNVIGNGFHTMRHMFVSPRSGITSHPAVTIFCVAENGDLLFFRYTGNGEEDPSGTLGFEGANQGNQIGNGFVNFRHIVGIGDRKFLAIPENGDLLYFHYTGMGEQDPSGTNGFVGEGNNSGNQIGNGFQGMRHLFGGVTSHNPPAPHRFAHHVFTVAENGDLLFFRYEGNGEQDPTGTLGFTGPTNPNSGNQIGNGF